MIDWFFHRVFVNVFCAFSDKQTGDRPKSPPPATSVDPILLEPSQQEAEKPVGESTAVAQGILSCHSALVVSSFLYSDFLCCCRVLCLDRALLAVSGQTIL